jgi:arsenical pump membrane protein
VTAIVVVAALLALVTIVALRPHGLGPPLGSSVAVAIVALGGLLALDDAGRAAATLWRPFVTLASIMALTATAEQLGLLERIASVIEPRTRGPVRHAFRITFALSALVAAALSNDAAILLLTPVVLTLLRTVYPKRYPKFCVPFAFAIFAAAGVAPLITSNPMNLVVADHAGIGFNVYAARMIPVALAGWLVAYAVLARIFHAELSDEVSAPGAWPAPTGPLGPAATIVLVILGGVLLAYPIVAYLDGPLWLVAATGATAALAIARNAGVPARSLAGSIAWSVFPFLLGVFLVAIALERAGVVAWLAARYAGDAPLATIALGSAAGSALLNNHPMAILNMLALDRLPTAGDAHVLAALIGGDLGPRLLPMGSLAGLLWIDSLRRHGVAISVGTFVRVGIALTIPTLAISLAVLWLVT